LFKILRYPNLTLSDLGNREDCSVYNSHLVYCRTEEEALIIISIDENINVDTLDAEPMELKTIDTMNKYFLD
jgi:hypothetical protein